MTNTKWYSPREMLAKDQNLGVPGPRMWFMLQGPQRGATVTAFGGRWLITSNQRGDLGANCLDSHCVSFQMSSLSFLSPPHQPLPPSLAPAFGITAVENIFFRVHSYENWPFLVTFPAMGLRAFSSILNGRVMIYKVSKPGEKGGWSLN